MDPNRERIRQLLRAYTQGKLSKSEFDELFSWLNHAGNNVTEDFKDIWNSNEAKELPGSKAAELFENIKADPRFKSQATPTFKQRSWRYVRIAAILIVCFSIAALIYFNQSNSEPSTRSASVDLREGEILPGGNKAILELSDGRALLLDDVQGEISMNPKGVLYANGTVVGSEFADNIQQTEELILRIPRGGQYRVILEDGTSIRLNAGSTLRYPVRFSKNRRQVYLEGEGYFEVAKDPERPFVIESHGTLVEVLGTSFNVSAYKDDNKLVTTVVSGSVKVSRGDDQVVLLPNQSATLRRHLSAGIEVDDANIEQGVAWTKGVFMFDREDIPAVMKRIGRWYDADIVLQGNFRNKTLGGTVSRYENIRELLDVLALTGHFKYKIDGRRIIVME